MSKICQITGSRPSTGNTRSHAMNAGKRRYIPNLVVKKVKNPLTGKVEKMRITARALRSLDKKMC
ncbi:50S ribosomal protein L28 [Candidatus Peregrinibacteria bacterium CG10_big_fil_rev_8_21_14_0_10_36_19]|nr:MAG: 50S ribosomal protein L28 [Candidatus Peregrinibacteria bacterium CG10_big_fil_rev_8_21_14_0_10_36_19]